MTKRIDGAFKLVDQIYAGFLKHLLEGESPLATHIRNDLALLRQEFAGVIDIWWDDIQALQPTTPRETIVRVGRLLTPAKSIHEDIPVVRGCQACLLSVDLPIKYRDELTNLAERYHLPTESLEYLHRYIRDGIVWEADHWDPSGSLQISIVAAIGRVEIEKRDGKEFYIIPADEAPFRSAWINPVGDLTEIDSIFDQLSKSFKDVLKRRWTKRLRSRDPTIAAYCAYLRVVEGLAPIEIWRLALRNAPGRWRDAENLDLTRRRMVQQYVGYGKKVLGWAQDGPTA